MILPGASSPDWPSVVLFTDRPGATAAEPEQWAGISARRRTKMKAILLIDYGDVDKLELRELPDPKAGPGEVRVNVAAASINPSTGSSGAARCAPGCRRNFRPCWGARRSGATAGGPDRRSADRGGRAAEAGRLAACRRSGGCNRPRRRLRGQTVPDARSGDMRRSQWVSIALAAFLVSSGGSAFDVAGSEPPLESHRV